MNAAIADAASRILDEYGSPTPEGGQYYAGGKAFSFRRSPQGELGIHRPDGSPLTKPTPTEERWLTTVGDRLRQVQQQRVEVAANNYARTLAQLDTDTLEADRLSVRIDIESRTIEARNGDGKLRLQAHHDGEKWQDTGRSRLKVEDMRRSRQLLHSVGTQQKEI